MCNIDWQVGIVGSIGTVLMFGYVHGWFWGLFPWDRNPNWLNNLRDKTEIHPKYYDGDHFTGRP